MNRKQRRMAKAREQSVQVRQRQHDLRQPEGPQVEGLWPDVQWTNDEVFSRAHSAQWLFTHVRVSRLPPHLEETTPLAFATPDSLALAVAMALFRGAWPVRVAYYTGEGDDLHLNTFGSPPNEAKGADLALYADYVPPGGYTTGCAARHRQLGRTGFTETVRVTTVPIPRTRRRKNCVSRRSCLGSCC